MANVDISRTNAAPRSSAVCSVVYSVVRVVCRPARTLAVSSGTVAVLAGVRRISTKC